MKRYVSLTGVLAAVAIVGFVGAVSVGLTVGSADGEGAADADTTDTSQESEQQGIPVKEAAPGIGLRADISDYPVTLDGKPMKGEKVLHVLGDTLFLNMRPLQSPESTPEHWAKCVDEFYVLFDHMVFKNGNSMHEALKRIAGAAEKFPGVVKAPDEESIRPRASALTIHFKDVSGHSILVAFNDTEAEEWITHLRNSPARESAIKHFHRILTGIKSGRRLKVREGQKYELKSN